VLAPARSDQLGGDEILRNIISNTGGDPDS
jgi:hypothetical protein